MARRKADPEPEPVDPEPTPEPEPEPTPEPQPEPEPIPDPEPDPDDVHVPDYDPTPPPEEPVSWNLDTVFVAVEDEERDSLGGWQNHNRIVEVTLVSNENGDITFDFDDNGNGPANVIVYTNGRP